MLHLRIPGGIDEERLCQLADINLLCDYSVSGVGYFIVKTDYEAALLTA